MKNEWLENETKLLKKEMKMRRGTFKEAWGKYWINYMALIFFAILLLYKCKSPAEEYHELGQINASMHRCEMANLTAFENQCETRILCRYYTMNAEYDKCTTFLDKRDFHKKNADRCFNEAKNMCWYLPAGMRDKSFYAFSNMAVLASPGTPYSKLVTVLVNTLMQYGADCVEDWNNITTKLNWAQYHYEMQEFYSDLIRHGQG